MRLKTKTKRLRWNRTRTRLNYIGFFLGPWVIIGSICELAWFSGSPLVLLPLACGIDILQSSIRFRRKMRRARKVLLEKRVYW